MDRIVQYIWDNGSLYKHMGDMFCIHTITVIIAGLACKPAKAKWNAPRVLHDSASFCSGGGGLMGREVVLVAKSMLVL